MNTQAGKSSGGDVVHNTVRAVICETPPGDERMMSAGIMVELLVERGLALHLAKRLYSQIRKGAPLHDEWRDAFAEGRFHQRQGRAAMPGEGPHAGALEGAADSAREVLGAADANPGAAPSRASARRSAPSGAGRTTPAPHASAMTFWLDPTFSESGSEKETLNLFNNAADVMGTHPNGVARGPFDGFVEVGSLGYGEHADAFLHSLLPPPQKRRRAPEAGEAAPGEAAPGEAAPGVDPGGPLRPPPRAAPAAAVPLGAPADELFRIVFNDLA